MSSYDPFDDAQRQLAEMKRMWQKSRRPLSVAAVVLAGLLVAFTAYYQVEADEVGVVLRLGEYLKTSEPGPSFKLPLGIDRVIKIPAKRQLKMEFGFRTVSADIRSQYSRDRQAVGESKMLTGDLNVGIVEWIVQYRIVDPVKYLFKFRNIDATLRMMSEAAMRSVVGDHSIDELITGGREAIEIEAKRQLQELNSRYDTGINIQQLKLQDANVTDVVKPALREVEEAKQERERAINIAEADYNKVIPRARGLAQETLAAAEGYKVERINEAQGDAARFSALYEEYRRAPEVTRTRLYLEAMGEILPKAKTKVLVDADTKGLVPLLNLSELKGGK